MILFGHLRSKGLFVLWGLHLGMCLKFCLIRWFRFFEPLSSKPLRVITMKTIFTLSCYGKESWGAPGPFVLRSFSESRSLSIVPSELVAKTESERNPLPFLSCLVFRKLRRVERLLCPVQGFRTYLATTASLAPHPRSLCPLTAH